MTREEAIKKLESLKISLPAAKDEISGIIKLIETPWISVKDDLPCNHKELMRSSFFTRTVLALSDGIGHEFARMHKTVTDGWEWTSIRNVKYWMPIPKFQKE